MARCKKKNGKSHIEIIGEIKMSTNLDTLCENIPDCFKNFLVYCRELSFDETPDYTFIKQLFLTYSEDNNIVPSFLNINNKY